MPHDITSDDGLTPQQRAFVAEMLVDNNPGLAALRAGYSPNVFEDGSETADDLLANPRVQEALETARAQRDARVSTTQATVLHELSLLALSSLEHYYVNEDGYVVLSPGAPAGALRALQSMRRKVITRTSKDGDVTRTVDVELRLWDKPGSLKTLGRHVGLFPDRFELTGKDGGPLAAMTEEQLAARASEVAAMARQLAEGSDGGR